jgi:hypothetical protein
MADVSLCKRCGSGVPSIRQGQYSQFDRAPALESFRSLSAGPSRAQTRCGRKPNHFKSASRDSNLSNTNLQQRLDFTMGVKRKRSSFEASPSSSTSSLFPPSDPASPTPPMQCGFEGLAMEVDPPSSHTISSWMSGWADAGASRMHSRTRKRLRNRPDEQLIHGM